MPLPPLPFNNTDIAWLKYTSCGIQHELMFRQPAATPQGDIIANAVALANAVKSLLPSADAFIGLRHQDSGSNLSFPLAWTSIAGTGAAFSENDDKAKFLALAGRSLSGYRCRITLFTPHLSDSYQYRYNAGTALNTAVQAMEPPAVAIDGNEVIWHAYSNIGYNAYWQRRLRKL